jgi:hypothetical protein
MTSLFSHRAATPGLRAPLVAPSTNDYINHPGKSCLAVSEGPVHVQPEGCRCVPEAKGHPLEQAEVAGDGSLLHVLWVKAGLMAPLPQVNLRDVTARRLGSKIKHAG